MKKQLCLITALFILVCTSHGSTSYNLPLEITDIALNSRLSRDSGSDATEIASGYSTTGRSGGSSLGAGSARNNGLDVVINLGWYPSAFGNESVLMRLFFLKPSPLVYSPEGIQLDSRFNTRILAMTDDNEDSVIDGVKLLRSNGMILEYRLVQGSTTRFEPSENYISYPTYLIKESENEYHRYDQMGNRIIYRLNDLENSQDDEVWYRSYLGNTITDSSTGIDVEVIHLNQDETSYIRQIRTAQTLVDIDDSELLQERYTMNFYKTADIGSKDADGYYTYTGTPFASWEVENPAMQASEYSKVKITKTIHHSGGLESYVYDYHYNEDDGWLLVKAEGEKNETLSKYPDVSSDGIFHSWVIADDQGSALKNYTELVTPFQWGNAVTERTIRTGGAEGEILTQKLDYFDNPNELSSYGKMKSIENPDGSWLKFDYDEQGRIGFKTSPWENSSFDESTNVVSTEYDYEAHGDDDAPGLLGIARTVTTRVNGLITGKVFNSYQITGTEAKHIIEKAHSQSANYGDLLNERVINRYYGVDASIAQVKRSQRKSVLYPNGRMDSFDYREDESGHLFTTVIQGSELNPGGIANKTTKSVVETDEKGNQLGLKVYICIAPDTYSAEPLTQVSHEYDEVNNLIKTYKNGRLVYEAIYEGTHLVKVTGEGGGTYEYDYDLLERLTEVIKWGVPAYGDYPAQASIATITEFNAASQKVRQTIGALKADGSLELPLAVQYEYDTAGRVNKMINPGFGSGIPGGADDFVTTSSP